MAYDTYQGLGRPAQPLRLSVDQLGDYVLALAVFLIGFVFFEPAPYELFIILLIVIWFACGLTLHRAFIPLTLLLLCFVLGGVIAATQMIDVIGGFFYVVTTGFLATTSIFFAALVTERPQSRLKIIFKAYLYAAVTTSAIGILAYFNYLPNSQSYMFAGRAKSTFQDPNVFGPFLALAIVFVVREILVNRLRQSKLYILALTILSFAVFLAFSRAAWGLTVVSFILIVGLTFLTARTTRLRSKIIALSITIVTGAIALLLIAISFDEVRSIFVQRAQLVQSYDSAQFGRFARYTFGLVWIMEAPLGYGFGKFRDTFGEDSHNIYLKAFTVYGWLGGVSYITLVLTTILTGFKHNFRETPWQGYFQCCYVVVIGHAMVGIVVDIDRWRHVYLIYGLIWGMIAANSLLRSGRYQRKPTKAVASP